MKYFKDVKSLDELKAQYRRLAREHHPDKGGDLETMKAINAEHDELFELLKADQNRRADADTTGKTRHTTETAEEFRDILDVLLRLDGLEIELCGCWLWIGGDTITHKEALKAAGCRWSSNKKMWYWRHPEDGYHGKSHATMGEIRTKYGSQMFCWDGETSDHERIGATA